MNLAFEKLVKNGVANPTDLRNFFAELLSLQRQGLVVKKRKGAKVYYELSDSALPLLNTYREMLLNEAKVEAYLRPKNQQLKALLEDLRFLNPRTETAEKYKFLGDWQLKYPVLPNHLKLAHLKYYEQENR